MGIDIMLGKEKINRKDRKVKAKRHAVFYVALLALLPAWISGCVPPRGFDVHLKSIVKAHQFSVVGWEVKAIPYEMKQSIFFGWGGVKDEIEVVTEYFSLTKKISTLRSKLTYDAQADGKLSSDVLEAELNRLQNQKRALTGTVERILEKQIRETLTELGIFNPIVGLRVSSLPVNLKLEKPPNLLVISSRDRVETVRKIILKSDLTREGIDYIESRVDRLGVSSLVVGLGGLGATYPTLVADEANLQSVIETGVHEWLHQYLAFKPLGFFYLLDLTGLRRNYDVAVMNETLASMLGKEIGGMVYDKYYASLAAGASQNLVAATEFDVDREIREIRRTVDSYLARGEIDLAEAFMEKKRRFLATMGHDIRKLNQAYLAFYDTYADSPTSINPIGAELKKLRAQSGSIKNFLDTVAVVTSRQQLRDSIE